MLIYCIKRRILGTIYEPTKETSTTGHVYDEVELAIQELLQGNSRSRLLAVRLITKWVETRYKEILNLSSSKARKEVIKLEHNEIVYMNHFNYPHSIESETFLDRIEEGANATLSGLKIVTRTVLSSSSVTTRYLPSFKRPSKWRYEQNNYQHQGYRCRVTNRQFSGGPSVYICGLRISLWSFFEEDMMDEVTVFIEISPPGVRHRNVYALNATSDDVASRVAFLIVAKKRSNNSVKAFYPSSKGEFNAIFKTNAIADRLIEGASYLEIAARPRRYLCLRSTRVPELLEFVGGKYTSAF